MTGEPLPTVRDHFAEFVDRAEREHERVVITRNGRPAVVLISDDDLAVSAGGRGAHPSSVRAFADVWP